MVQNYYYLNEEIIRNNYFLPLILDIVENKGTKKVFIKMNLQWGYNNVWIKKEDKWKMVFTILKKSFKPMVMFFGLTNFPTIFQTMINKILRNLINVASFIDNIIVEIEKEKVKGILDWLILKGVKDAQKFLELANYYWQFIKNFAIIARPLHDLVKKDQK